MSHLSRESAQDDTLLGPVLFPDGTDRRTSARIPMTARVRIGPPGGVPTSLVSASDLSVGGLFVDADREVRVGARFSVEVPLEDGVRLYIPEAEVAYNRNRSASSGFGVRFVDLEPEAHKAIASAIDVATGLTTDVVERDPKPVIRSQRPDLSGLPTIVPSAFFEDSIYPEPSIVGEGLAIDDPLDLEDERFPRSPGAVSVLFARVVDLTHDARLAVAERARRTPKLFGGIAAVGAVTLLAAFGITMWSGGNAQAVEPKDGAHQTVPASTHQVLMGTATIDALGAPKDDAVEAPRTSNKKRNALPPLVKMDEPRSAKPHGIEVLAAKTEKPTPPVAKPTAAKPAAVEKPAVVAAKPEPAKRTEAKSAPEKIAEAKDEARMSAKAAAILGSSPDRIRIPIVEGARVLKTHVFRSPNRYVIDLVDQPCPITAPRPSGAITNVRSGRHPEYCRVVLDVAQHFESGSQTIRGGELVVELSY